MTKSYDEVMHHHQKSTQTHKNYEALNVKLECVYEKNVNVGTFSLLFHSILVSSHAY